MAPPAPWLLLQFQPQIVPPAITDSHLVQEEMGSTARAPGHRHRQQPPIKLQREKRSPEVRAPSWAGAGSVRRRGLGALTSALQGQGYIWHTGGCAQGRHVAESEVRDRRQDQGLGIGAASTKETCWGPAPARDIMVGKKVKG